MLGRAMLFAACSVSVASNDTSVRTHATARQKSRLYRIGSGKLHLSLSCLLVIFMLPLRGRASILLQLERRQLQTSACSADLDSSSEVDVTDLLTLLGAFGTSADGDTNSDGTTDVTDLLTLLGAFGQTCDVAGDTYIETVGDCRIGDSGSHG